jgi:hypothetical protein
VHMSVRRLTAFAIALTFSLTAVSFSHAQETKTRRGRKYKAPAETSHIEVLVLRENNGKPLLNAAVVFHPVKDGKDEGNLEVKTNSDGKAIIDVIPTGSNVGVQVIADGFATYAGDYLVSEPSRDIVIKMLKPQAQISTYEEMHGKASDRPVGVQEPRKPSTPPVVETPKPTNHTSDPNPLTPVSPNATTGNSQNRTPQ